MEQSSLGPQPTIGLVCPLFLELQAVKLIFDGAHVEERLIYNNDELENIYYYGRIGNCTAVAVKFASRRFGPQEAGIQAQKLLSRHSSLRHPNSFCFLVGVAAGIWDEQNDVRLGDVVIATQVVDWTSGKVNTGYEFESTEHAHDVTEELLQRVDDFVHNQGKLGKRIEDQMMKMLQKVPYEDHIDWQYLGPEHDILFKSHVRHVKGDGCKACEKDFEAREPRDSKLPRVHRGLIASGAVVLKDAATREQLKAYRHGRILAVEMEASGALRANPKIIIIRGVCDYADGHKNKKWQNHAALKAAACLWLWINDYITGFRAVEQATQLGKVDYPQRRRQKWIERPPNEFCIDLVGPIRNFQSPIYANRPIQTSFEDRSDTIHSLDADGLIPLEIDHTSSGEITNITNDDSSNTDQAQESSGTWQASLTLRLVRADMEIRNVKAYGKVELEAWADSTLVLELQNDLELGYSSRRLRINSENSRDRCIWLPHTRIRTRQRGATIKLMFSNCNRRERRCSGPYTSIGGLSSYVTKYNPNEPNVTLKLQTVNEEEAEKLCQHILFQNQDFAKWTIGSAKTLSFCTIAWRKGSPIWEPDECLLVRYTEDDQRDLDLGGFGDKIDFDIYAAGETFHLFLGYMVKFQYEPVDKNMYKAEPPMKVRQNQEGRPGDTRFSGRDQAESGLVLVVREDQIQEALNRTLGRVVEWVARFFAADIKIKLQYKGRSNHNRTVTGQVSAWTEGRRARLFIRMNEPEKHDVHQWMACTLYRLQGHPPAIDRRGKMSTVLSEIELAAGDFLTKDGFEPVKDNTKSFVNGRPPQIVWKKVKLKWTTAAQKEAFEDLLCHYCV